MIDVVSIDIDLEIVSCFLVFSLVYFYGLFEFEALVLGQFRSFRV